MQTLNRILLFVYKTRHRILLFGKRFPIEGFSNIPWLSQKFRGGSFFPSSLWFHIAASTNYLLPGWFLWFPLLPRARGLVWRVAFLPPIQKICPLSVYFVPKPSFVCQCPWLRLPHYMADIAGSKAEDRAGGKLPTFFSQGFLCFFSLAFFCFFAGIFTLKSSSFWPAFLLRPRILFEFVIFFKKNAYFMNEKMINFLAVLEVFLNFSFYF